MLNQRQAGRRIRPLRPVKRALLIFAFAMVGGSAVVWAQVPVSAVAAAAEADANAVRLMVGRSAVLDVGANIARVSLTSADIADAMVTSPQQLLINGKTPGTISLFVWDRAGSLKRYEVIVQRDLARLTEQMGELFPNERISVQSNGRNVVLTGTVTNKDVIERAVSIAAGYVEKREEVVTLLQLQAGAPSNQVLLRVRFAEVSRSAMTELGANFAANGYRDGRWYGRSTTQQFPAPEWDEQGRFVFSDFLNLFLFDSKNELAAVIKMLQQRGLFQSLAEPNLVAESGKEASFLAGGEFPIPIAQGTGGNVAITVEWKEFGIRLNFTPTVNGDRVHLRVRPEVSALDFNNSIVTQGFRVPSLTTRRTETELELDNRQTFAIAGLLNNTINESLQRIPGIGDIPILGYLFRSKAAQKNQTELVVMITPEILPAKSPGVTPDLPRISEPYLPPLPDNRLMNQPPPPFGAAMRPVGDPRIVTAPAVAAVAQPAGESAVQPAPSASAPESSPSGEPSAQPGPVSAVAPEGAPPAASALTPPQQRALDRLTREDERKAREAKERAEKELREMQARAERDARERQKAEEQAQAEEARKLAEQEIAAKREADRERERQEKLAREQAKRDAETARQAARDAERQAEADRRRQKAVEEAEARLKAAEAAYQAEIANSNRGN
jgi:pilus assembly protein CpaC